MRALTARAATAAAFAMAPSAAQAATTCTWGGTPEAPTGTTIQRPGLTNDPAPAPMWFKATGELAGGPGCSGTFTFTGSMDAGSTCALVTFHGRARGLRGVARFAGVSAAGLAPARLYDARGRVVGSENAQFLTGSDATSCNTPEGMTGNRFSSVIVLPDHRRATSASTASTASTASMASRRAPRRANTFDGTCRLTGEFTFDRPLGNTLVPITFTDYATGTCTGTLNGRPYDGPAVNQVTGSGTASCLAAHASSHDTLTFDDGVTIHLSTDVVGVPPQLAGRFGGAVSGDGVVEVSLLAYTDQSTLAACSAGTLRSARYDLVARTITPMTG